MGDAGVVAFVIAVVLLAITAQTVAGFGFSLIAVPFLVIVLDVRDVVVLTAIPALLNSALVVRIVRLHVPWRTVAVLLAGSFAGMPIGLVVLLNAPDEALRIAVGVVSIALALALAGGRSLGLRGAYGELGAGFASGVLNTSTSMNGPPVVLYLQDLRLTPSEFRGALAAFFFATGIVSLALFGVSGVASARALALSAAAVPAVFAGNALGHALLGRVSDELFRRIVFVLLIATAVASIGLSIARIAR